MIRALGNPSTFAMIATGLSGTDIASPAYHVAADYNRDGMIAAKIYIPYDY